eukprot:m.11882 g.11882  ORF g.11882 m.11882 type:complete len:627 (-) comp9031_c0_seq1:459-2339(-)
MLGRGISIDGTATAINGERVALLGIAEEDKFQGLRSTGRFCGAVIDDYQRRSKVYISDFVDGFHAKTLSAFLFMFFATFASTVALGVVVDDAATGTNKCMGVTELVLSLSIAGMIHSLFSGCPMAVLRPTGPITLFIIKLYGLSASLQIDFFDWFAWVGFWIGVYMILIAVFDLCRHIRLATRFLHDLFAFFVCTIYIHDGIAGVVGLWPDKKSQIGPREQWQNNTCETLACAYFSFILFSCTLFGGLLLNAITSTRLINAKGREFVKDYALTIAIFASIFIGYASQGAQQYHVGINETNEQYIPHIELPRGVSPTFNNLPQHNYTNRQWWVGLSASGSEDLQGEYNASQFKDKTVCGDDTVPCGIKGMDIVFAALAAIPITFWFYFDQLFSCLLHQIGLGPDGKNLTKGAYYHSSFLWVGIFNMVLPMFGLPFVTASLPHSPQFVRALQIKDKQTGKVTGVVDNRIAPFLMYLLCGLSLILPGGGDRKLLELIPKGVVYGILTFVGVAGILPETGNQFSKRVLLLFSFPSEFPKEELFTHVAVYKMHLFTFCQAAALVTCWVITISNTFGTSQFWQYIGIFFPLWIVALIPIRKKLLPMLLPEEDLKRFLDAEAHDENTELPSVS